MAQGTCSVGGCGKSSGSARGLCRMHYMRWWKTGSVRGPVPENRRGMDNSECSVAGCDSAVRCQGLCDRHYHRMRDWGDPTHPRQSNRGLPALERFGMRVQVDGESGCWLWTGKLSANGYGRFTPRGPKTIPAHRYSYELFGGLVLDGEQLDHLCRVRNCVNPAHLEPVTPRENSLRSLSTAALNARKTHCKRGHPLSGANLYVRPTGARVCRECKNAAQRTAQQ